jgi:GGDEF domain-containing protein
MVDVDHFKKFNDLFGHDTGDQVLRMVSSRLGAVTGGGHAFRCGGEEFAVVFRGRTLREAFPHLEAVRQAIEETVFTVRGTERVQRTERDRITGTPRDRRSGRRREAERDVRVTVSIGLAQAARAWMAPEDVVMAADKALYRAKAAGRNCVEVAGAAVKPTAAEPALR